jgi:hypothetical protein
MEYNYKERRRNEKQRRKRAVFERTPFEVRQPRLPAKINLICLIKAKVVSNTSGHEIRIDIIITGDHGRRLDYEWDRCSRLS